MKLSPQKEKLVAILRDMKEHCASEWANFVKDDRTRFCELEPYMTSRGYKITSVPCRGSVCGRRACPLNKRQAVKIGSPSAQPTKQDLIKRAAELCRRFDANEPVFT